MHISEGILSGPVIFSGMAMAAAGTGVGLRKLDLDRIPQAGIMSASFFVASLVHVPIGPSSAHLILNGIVGLILGWAAFPSILVALILQSAFFQYGGITTLGVNTVIMALPAVLCYMIFGRLVQGKHGAALVGAFACGLVSVLASSFLVGLALFFTEEDFLEVSAMVIAAHLPVMLIEGIVTAICVAFLKRVKPDIFENSIKVKTGE